MCLCSLTGTRAVFIKQLSQSTQFAVSHKFSLPLPSLSMSTNVFGNCSASMASAASAAGSRHHHSAGIGGTQVLPSSATSMLHHSFAPVAEPHQQKSAAAEALASALANNTTSSPTAFPFPPPSPLFLPSPLGGSLQQSPTAAAAAQHLHHLQQSLSMYMNQSPVGHPHHPHHLYNMALGAGKSYATSLKESQSLHFHGSDDNNNDVLSTAISRNGTPTKQSSAEMNGVEHQQHRSAFVSPKQANACNGEGSDAHSKPENDNTRKSYSPPSSSKTHNGRSGM